MEMYPNVLGRYNRQKFVRQIKDLVRNLPDTNPEIVEKRLAEVDATHQKLAANPPPQIEVQRSETPGQVKKCWMPSIE